jgi:hypothetical protein
MATDDIKNTVEYSEDANLDEKQSISIHEGIPRPEDLKQDMALQTGEADSELKERERRLLWKIDLRYGSDLDDKVVCSFYLTLNIDLPVCYLLFRSCIYWLLWIVYVATNIYLEYRYRHDTILILIFHRVTSEMHVSVLWKLIFICKAMIFTMLSGKEDQSIIISAERYFSCRC